LHPPRAAVRPRRAVPARSHARARPPPVRRAGARPSRGAAQPRRARRARVARRGAPVPAARAVRSARRRHPIAASSPPRARSRRRVRRRARRRRQRGGSLSGPWPSRDRPALVRAPPATRRAPRDGLARPRQLRGEPATLPLALGALARERGRRGRELFVAGEERALVVAQPDLVALAEQMRALGLDARGACLRERDARARRLLLGDTGGVGVLARAARPRGGLRVDAAPAFAQGRQLRGERRERRAGPLALGGDRREARLERGHALADARFGG